MQKKKRRSSKCQTLGVISGRGRQVATRGGSVAFGYKTKRAADASATHFRKHRVAAKVSYNKARGLYVVKA